MMKKLLSFLCGCLVMATMAVPALAVDNYSFSTENPDEFYQTGVTTVTYDGAIHGYVQELYDFTPQTVHTSEHGATVIVPELDPGYGLGSEKPTNAPGGSGGGSAPANAPQSGGSVSYPSQPGASTEQTFPQYALTPVEDVRKKDGSIGTLKIPAIGLTVTAYDGELTAAMKKGVGHIDSTSAWNGNIGIVGHNRGVTLHFGKLKNLKAGDEITYSTTLGSRTYVVTTVQKIASDDWSYLQYTTDNRLTLLTCVENQPQYRLVVQAAEKR
ncbi:class D sortase [Oscillospiraceae bacterium OttesenSCG-928-G22]|nr:class D sortase [Oscillospiraceae bacterium OttesenSCG-928-G22]